MALKYATDHFHAIFFGFYLGQVRLHYRALVLTYRALQGEYPQHITDLPHPYTTSCRSSLCMFYCYSILSKALGDIHAHERCYINKLYYLLTYTVQQRVSNGAAL